MSTPLMFRPMEEVADFFARGPAPEEIARFRLSDATTARARELLERNADGTITREEIDELDQLVLLDRMVTLIRSRLPTMPHNQGMSATSA